MGVFYTREELVQARQRWRSAGKTVVFTNGCYDILHPGHIRLLERARATFESFDDATSVSYCDDHLGWVAVSRGQYDIARAHFERCAAVARAHHDDWTGAHALSALAPLLAALAGSKSISPLGTAAFRPDRCSS